MPVRRARRCREFLELVGAGLGVKAFHVAALADFQRCVHEHFDEASGREDGPHLVAVRSERGDEGGDDDVAGVGKQSGDFARAPDVLAPRFRREIQIAAQAAAAEVAVEQVGVPAFEEKFARQFGGDGGLARAAQAGEPDDQALVAVAPLALG